MLGPPRTHGVSAIVAQLPPCHRLTYQVSAPRAGGHFGRDFTNLVSNVSGHEAAPQPRSPAGCDFTDRVSTYASAAPLPSPRLRFLVPDRPVPGLLVYADD